MLKSYWQKIIRYTFADKGASKFLRFGFSGGVSAFTNITVLFLCVEFFNLSLLIAINVAFLFGVLINFLLQKIFTFREFSHDVVPRQLFLFFLGAAVNVILNNQGVYYLTQVMGIWYIFGQVIMLGCLAMLNFSFYIFVVFRSNHYFK